MSNDQTNTATAVESADSPWRGGRPWAIAIVLFAVVAFQPAIHNEWAHDDRVQVAELEVPDTAMGWLDAIARPWWPPDRYKNLWRPFTRYSILVQKAIHERTSWPFYAFNIFLHAAVSVLLFGVARRMGLRRWAAGSGALIFAAHPIHAEAIHQVVGRAELFAAFWMLLGLGSWLKRGLKDPQTWWIQPACYALALGSKEHAVLYPVFILLAVCAGKGVGDRTQPVDRAEKQRPPWSHPWETWRSVLVLQIFLGVVLVFFLVAKYSVTGGLIESTADIPYHENPLATMTLVERIPAVLGIFAYAASRLFWPGGLCPDYSAFSFPFEQGWSLSWVGVVLLLPILIGGAINAKRGGCGWTLAAAGLIAYALTSNLVRPIGVATAERLWYWPSVPVCLGLGCVVAWVRDRLGVGRAREAILVLVLIMAGLLSGAWIYAPAWRSQTAYAQWTVDRFPRSWRGHVNMAQGHFNHREFGKGLKAARWATELLPDNPFGWDWVGMNAMFIESQQGAAEGAFLHALDLDPSLYRVHYHLSNLYESRGRYAEAIVQLEAYLEKCTERERFSAQQRLDRLRRAGKNKPGS